MSEKESLDDLLNAGILTYHEYLELLSRVEDKNDTEQVDQTVGEG